MSSISVLHVVPYYPPDRLGGVGEVAAHVHRELLRRGHQSHVLTSGTSRDDPTVTRLVRSPTGFALRSWAGAALVDDVDVIHAHQGEGLGVLLAARRRRPDIPILVTLHVSYAGIAESFRPDRRHARGRGRAERAFARRFVTAPVHRLLDTLAIRTANQLSFISESTRRDVVGSVGSEMGPVIYNGLPPAIPTEPSATRTDLLYVGALGRRKRVRLLPEILNRVQSRLAAASLRIVGFDLDEDPELKRMFEERGLLGSVVAEGRVRSEQIPPFYAAAKVLIVPSAYEGLPMVILEAGRYRLPCVATDVSGHPEVIEDGKNGFLVPKDDPQAMADRAVQLLTDPPLRDRMAAAAESSIDDRFSVERQVDQYLDLYRQIQVGISR